MSHEIEILKAEIQELKTELLATQSFAALFAVFNYAPSVSFDAAAFGISVPVDQADKFSAALGRIMDTARSIDDRARRDAAVA